MKNNKFIYPLSGIIIFLILWHITAAWVIGKEWILPTPWAVLSSFGENLGLVWHHSIITLGEAGLGIVFAILLSISFALLMNLSPPLQKTIYPLLLGSQMIPIIVLAPLFIIWFGYGLLPKVLVVILICFFPITINILSGLKSTNAETIAFYRSMGMNRRQLFSLIHLPTALPYFFAGLRIAAVYSIMGAVIGEWLGSQGGLGVLLVRAQKAFDLPLVFAAILAIIIWSALVFLLVKMAEGKFLGWQKHVNQEKWQ